MSRFIYRFSFSADVPIEEIEVTLVLAVLTVESLHGEAQTRLDASHAFDAEKRTCVIDSTTSVGKAMCRLFAGFLRREFGEDSFRVERLAATTAQLQPAGAGV
jgi:hypothetical protein